MNQSKIAIFIEKTLIDADGISEKDSRDIAFHMTDWINELSLLIKLYENPDSYHSENASKIIIDFLIHAPEHIAEASRLLTGYTVKEIFNVNTHE